MKKRTVIAIFLVVLCFFSTSFAASKSRVLCDGWQDASLAELQQAQTLLEEKILSLSEVTDKNVTVWYSKSGKKYHSKSTCSNMKKPMQITLSEAKKKGLGPCSKCN